MRPTLILVGIALLALVPESLTAQSAQDATAIQAVRAVADAVDKVDPNQLVQTLIRRFGPRLTGSDSEHQSAAWALDEMRRAGLSDVHTETWTLHRGWKRLRAAARLRKPYEAKLEVDSYGWSGSTHGGVSGEVVLVDGNSTLTKEAVRNWSGKIVLVAPSSKDGILGVADAPVLANWAEKAGALAVIDGITRPGGMLHTGPIGFPGRESSVPILDMPEVQRQQLEHLVRQGAKPKIWLDVANRFTDASISAENVVGEIVGALHPEQIVLLGAHLDSWDLSPGAADDGTGVAAGLATATRNTGLWRASRQNDPLRPLYRRGAGSPGFSGLCGTAPGRASELRMRSCDGLGRRADHTLPTGWSSRDGRTTRKSVPS